MAKQLDGRSSIKTKSHRPSVWAGSLAILLLSCIIAIRLLGDRLYTFEANPTDSAIDSSTIIVCLAGGKLRIETAFELFAKGLGRQLLIVGAGPKATPQSIVRAVTRSSDSSLPPERLAEVYVETDSRNTIENAFAVNRFLQQHPNTKKIVLVTSGYHLRRSKLMLENQIIRGVEILPYTPSNEAIHRQNWWHSWLGIEVTVVELAKFYLASLLAPQLRYF